MNFWLEALGIIVIPLAASALFIGGYLWVANLWQRRAQRLRSRPVGKGPHN